jgi:hypothetical protein
MNRESRPLVLLFFLRGMVSMGAWVAIGEKVLA